MMESDDEFLFEQHSYGYEEEYLPPTPWWDLRARWGLMSGGHRTNVVLYALGAVSLALLMLELTAGENNPDLEAAGSVIPAASSTSTSRPVATTRPSSTTTSRPPSSSATVAGTAGTIPRPVTTARPTAPVAADEDPVVVDPDPEPTDPPQQTTVAPAPTTSPTTQAPVTQPPVTEPDDTPITLTPRACELLAQYGQTHPSCP
jgi:cytoskeletal protein RodZ